MTIQQLYKEKKNLWAQAEDIRKEAEKENRQLTDEQLKTFDKLNDDMDSTQKRIDAYQRAEKQTIEDSQLIIEKKVETRTIEEYKLEAVDEMKKFMRGGIDEMSKEGCEMFGASKSKKQDVINIRAVGTQTTTTTAGGYTIDTEVSNFIEKARKQFGGMFEASRLIKTSKGGALYIPTVNDTGNTGALEGEGDDMFDGSTAITFGQATLNAYKYSSEGVNVSNELLQDSEFNMAQFLGECLGERLFRKLNTDFTLADGSSKPKGVTKATTVGENAPDSSIGRVDILGLIHSVDPAYRKSSKTFLMFNDNTLLGIKLLTFGTSDDRPLWQPSMRVGEPDTIEGFKYIINQDIVDAGSDTISMLFGDFSKFIIREVSPMKMVRLNERYAELDETGFIVLGRWDSDLIVATSSAPIKHIRNLGT